MKFLLPVLSFTLFILCEVIKNWHIVHWWNSKVFQQLTEKVIKIRNNIFESRKIDSKLEFEKCQYNDLFLFQEKIKQKLKYKAAKMASSQDALLTFFAGLRGFHVYRSCWKPYVKQKIEFRKEKNNCYDKYAVAGYTKFPGKVVLCVVGHMPQEISCYT